MLNRYLEDLRFIIGVFFSIIGSILILVGLIGPDAGAENTHLNLFAGGLMLAVAALMLSLSICAARCEKK